MADRAPQYIQTKKSPVYLDWWRENPIEIVLVVFALALFFLFPRTGCGISQADVDQGTVIVQVADNR